MFFMAIIFKCTKCFHANNIAIKISVFNDPGHSGVVIKINLQIRVEVLHFVIFHKNCHVASVILSNV